MKKQSANDIITKWGLRPFPLWHYTTAVTAFHISTYYQHHRSVHNLFVTVTHHCGLGYTKELLILNAEHIIHALLSFVSSKVENSVSLHVVYGFGWGWEAVQVSQQRETISSGSTRRVRASWQPMGPWWNEARPDWSLHSPGPRQWALSHRTPVKPAEQ